MTQASRRAGLTKEVLGDDDIDVVLQEPAILVKLSSTFEIALNPQQDMTTTSGSQKVHIVEIN